MVPWLPPLTVVLGEWGPQVDGELADVAAGLLVGDTGVHDEQLHQGLLHEVDEGQALGEGTAVSHLGDVYLLEDQAQDSILLVPAD